MTFRDDYSNQLVKKLKKLRKKNPGQFKIICKKRDEVLRTPVRYKNLRYDMSGRKRVHVDKHFVLVFKVNQNDRIVKFLDYDHHDNIYQK